MIDKIRDWSQDQFIRNWIANLESEVSWFERLTQQSTSDFSVSEGEPRDREWDSSETEDDEEEHIIIVEPRMRKRISQ
jgi:hypothetical protein